MSQSMEQVEKTHRRWWEKIGILVRAGIATAVPWSLVVDARLHTNISSTVSTNIVLVCAELATLSSDALELLLGRRVGIADLHQHALLANSNTMILLDDFLTLLTRVKAKYEVR